MPDNEEIISDDEIVKEIEAENERDYLKQLKVKHKGFLIEGLTLLERERIARHIIRIYNENKDAHKELCDKLDGFDSVFRMERETIPGGDEDMPNYRTPLSTVTVEVTHANVMNVFFSPKDQIRVLPTEENDIKKVNKLNIFSNWSAANELDLFNNCDRLFHSSTKNGECPYMVHWVKEYGTEIKREMLMNPANPEEPLIDQDTKEPIYQEIEQQKILFNAPKLEVFSRKDYIQPKNSVMGKTPDWEMIIKRFTYDAYVRDELAGKMYDKTVNEVFEGWGAGTEFVKEDFEGDVLPLGKHEQEFILFFGRLRVNIIKKGEENEVEDLYEELEDEFVALVHIASETLCQLRKNKYPLKERPIGIDYFIPDDDGRRMGIGVVEFYDGIQKSYDRLFNQFLYGVIASNSPPGFFEPTSNMRDEAIKVRTGYLYPTSNANSIKFAEIPQPNNSIQIILEMIRNFAQLLFGVSDYSAGVESQIDPSAPAKKAEIVLASGSVRLNMIIRRRNKTLHDIMRKWFLLYKDNMPPNKYMRIVGDSEDNPWQFQNISLSDFALNSIPDFEFTGNILNANKQLEVNKAIAVYNLMAQNIFFSPQAPNGLQANYALTKWLMDKLDETGLSRILPKLPGDIVHTPEEENARFLQGDSGKPLEQEDHMQHIKVHQKMLVDQTIPEAIKTQIVIPHIQAHVRMMQAAIQQSLMLQQTTAQPQQGGQFGQPGQPGNQAPAGGTGGVFQGQPAGVGQPQGGDINLP